MNDARSGESRPDPAFDITNCPDGVTYERGARGWVITASIASPFAWALVPFTCFWSGMSLGQIYVVPYLEDGAIGREGVPGFIFVIGTVLLIGVCAVAIAGRVRIVADGYDGLVFTGVGPIGLRRRFSWHDIDRVEEGLSRWKVNRRKRPEIRLEGRTRVRFGFLLRADRRLYVHRAIEALLAERDRG